MESNSTIIVFTFSLLSLITISTAVDTITATQSLRDNGETLVSAGGTFELGFFSPGKSQNRYLGIWYKKISTGTVVWVANREVPLQNSSGVLTLDGQGILRLLNSSNSLIWSSNLSTPAVKPVAQLLDTGNFVIRDENDLNNPNSYLWQSFDYMGDTFLPDMKIGANFVTGFNYYMTAWKSEDDPSPGDFTNKFNTNGYPQIFLSKGSKVQFRSGPWNGMRFSGMPNLKLNPIYTYEYVFNQEEVYYAYQLINSSVVSRMVLNSYGVLQRLMWIDRTQEWNLYISVETDDCDRYGLCGAYGNCNINNSPACECLEGFVPRSPIDWDTNWSNGCMRQYELNCGKGDGFRKYSNLRVPDTQHSWFNKTMNLKECEKACLKNCSCTAYANLDIRAGGSGCLLWFGDLIDMRAYNQNGEDIYIRLAAAELEESIMAEKVKRMRIIILPILIIGIVFLCLYLIFHGLKRNQQKQLTRDKNIYDSERYADSGEEKDLEIPLFDFDTIEKATNYFSLHNKLGEGGFGPVYKGTLNDRREIAVKRLSKDSNQGLDEFKNEVLCIGKLQHRNLVKLLGYCIQKEEKMLIYEYLPNKSLDFFIFDQTRSKLLGWSRRFHIINGIARGLLYLHQDSRLRIIHRDLKASNILLDHEMNPKISDFGMARSFGGNETSANTKRVVGTYGYMSPEYAIDGLFSVKSDVFSFGVLVLEILSGTRNRGFYHPDHQLNLLGHAWSLYEEGRSTELLSASVGNSCIIDEALRIIHVGLLCVQHNPEDRPSMSSVVLMLSSEIELPQPQQPGFFTERKLFKTDTLSSSHEFRSVNTMTVTLVSPR